MTHMVCNALRTPDGTVIQSYNRHDYKTHVDANGNRYMIDGGIDYVRSSAWGDEEYLTVTTDDPFEIIRESFCWGTRGKDGTEPLQYRALSKLDTDHIQAILDTQTQIPPWLFNIFETELQLRDNTAI
jgi:hypothetical protein